MSPLLRGTRAVTVRHRRAVSPPRTPGASIAPNGPGLPGRLRMAHAAYAAADARASQYSVRVPQTGRSENLAIAARPLPGRAPYTSAPGCRPPAPAGKTTRPGA